LTPFGIGREDALTPAGIQELTRRYFDLDNRVRVTLLPEELN